MAETTGLPWKARIRAMLRRIGPAGNSGAVVTRESSAFLGTARSAGRSHDGGRVRGFPGPASPPSLPSAGPASASSIANPISRTPRKPRTCPGPRSCPDLWDAPRPHGHNGIGTRCTRSRRLPEPGEPRPGERGAAAATHDLPAESETPEDPISRSGLLGRAPAAVVRLGASPAHGQARDRGLLAPSGIRALLASNFGQIRLPLVAKSRVSIRSRRDSWPMGYSRITGGRGRRNTNAQRQSALMLPHVPLSTRVGWANVPMNDGGDSTDQISPSQVRA